MVSVSAKSTFAQADMVRERTHPKISVRRRFNVSPTNLPGPGKQMVTPYLENRIYRGRRGGEMTLRKASGLAPRMNRSSLQIPTGNYVGEP
jgi:hypothetical protein